MQGGAGKRRYGSTTRRGLGVPVPPWKSWAEPMAEFVARQSLRVLRCAIGPAASSQPRNEMGSFGLLMIGMHGTLPVGADAADRAWPARTWVFLHNAARKCIKVILGLQNNLIGLTSFLFISG